jgi:hypothetical protein
MNSRTSNSEALALLARSTRDYHANGLAQSRTYSRRCATVKKSDKCVSPMKSMRATIPHTPYRHSRRSQPPLNNPPGAQHAQRRPEGRADAVTRFRPVASMRAATVCDERVLPGVSNVAGQRHSISPKL